MSEHPKVPYVDWAGTDAVSLRRKEADLIRQLIAQWRERANEIELQGGPGSGECAMRDCADELEALAERSHPQEAPLDPGHLVVDIRYGVDTTHHVEGPMGFNSYGVVAILRCIREQLDIHEKQAARLATPPTPPSVIPQEDESERDPVCANCGTRRSIHDDHNCAGLWLDGVEVSENAESQLQALKAENERLRAERDGLRDMLQLQMSLKDDYLKLADKYGAELEALRSKRLQGDTK